jgi:hypothetical protein
LRPLGFEGDGERRNRRSDSLPWLHEHERGLSGQANVRDR